MGTEREDGTKETALHRLQVGLVDWVVRHPWPVLVCALLVCGLSAFFAWSRLQFHTQRSDLISSRKDFHQRWHKYLAEFGDDDDMVVVVKGADRLAMQDALETLAREVDTQPKLFDRLFYKLDLRPLRNRALLFLSCDEISKIQENLAGMSLLLEPPLIGQFDRYFGWKSLTLANLLDKAGNVLAAHKDQPLGVKDEQFLKQLDAICRSAAAVLDQPSAYRNPWQSILRQPPGQDDRLGEPQYLFSNDGSLAFLLVRPIKEAGSFTAAHQSVEALRSIVRAIEKHFPKLEFGVTGLPVLENDEMVASQRDTTAASWLALAGVALLYLVVFRGIRYPLLTVGTLLVGTAWAMGWLTLTVGHLNILSATFAVMLIGMGDYGILWVTRYDQERQAGVDVESALRRTVGSVGPGILTAAVTTALAFYAAMLADFQAVAELGWIAGSGVLLCALSCFTVMPALLKLADRRQDVASANRAPPSAVDARCTNSTGAWLPFFSRRPVWVIGISLAATAALGVVAAQIRYDHNLLNLQARGLDSVKWELTLIDHTQGASWHALSYTANRETALALKARYEKLPCVSLVVEAASLVPAEQPHKLGQLRHIQHRLRQLPPRGLKIDRPIPVVPEITARLDRARQHITPSAPPLIRQLSDSMRALKDKLQPLDYAVAAVKLCVFEQWLTRDLAEDLHRLREVATPQPIQIADLPPEFRERHMSPSGQWLLRVFAKDSLWEYAQLRAFVDQIRTVDPEATGKPFGTLEGLKVMKHGFQWAGVYALVAMVIVLLLDFRSAKQTIVALAPLGMGLVMALGIMHLCGLTLNPANMIAFPLILGVGADNGVHVLHDYLNRKKGQPYTLSRTTGKGIMVAALTTILGFGTLMLAQHRGLAGLGLILTLGVACCMLTALIFLPAVLRLLSIRRERVAVKVLPMRLHDRIAA
jgi:hopanoid biosynthesis associated RND transporter like protein HpnN